MARSIGRRKVTATIPAGPVAVRLSTTGNKFVTDFTFHFPTGNVAASGYIGDSTVDATWTPYPKGATYNMVHGTGNLDGHDPVTGFNLAKIYVFTANAGDTCIIEYMDYDAI